MYNYIRSGLSKVSQQLFQNEESIIKIAKKNLLLTDFFTPPVALSLPLPTEENHEEKLT